MTDFINVFKMIYSKFSKWGIRLWMCSESPSDPLTEGRVREMVRLLIEQSWEPVEEARNSEVHPCPISSNLYDEMPEDELEDWIMETEDMQQALMMFRGERADSPDKENQINAWVMSEEEMEEMTLSNFLLDLVQTESDWQ